MAPRPSHPTRLRHARRLAALGVLVALPALLTTCYHVAPWSPDPRVVHTDTAFVSDGVRIAVERAAPPHAGRFPAVLVLHPSDGLDGDGGQYVRRVADAFALNGYVAYVVHYFDRTTTWRSNDELEDKDYPLWTRTLRDAVTAAQHDHSVDPRRIGAYGYSLGAYMALALGASDPRVRGIVVQSGGFFTTLEPKVTRLPPTLLLHGSDDTTVPIEEANKVNATLLQLHVPRSYFVFPGEGHSFTPGLDSTVTSLAIHFLDRDTGGPWWRRLLRQRSPRGQSAARFPAARTR